MAIFEIDLYNNGSGVICINIIQILLQICLNRLQNAQHRSPLCHTGSGVQILDAAC